MGNKAKGQLAIEHIKLAVKHTRLARRLIGRAIRHTRLVRPLIGLIGLAIRHTRPIKLAIRPLLAIRLKAIERPNKKKFKYLKIFT